MRNRTMLTFSSLMLGMLLVSGCKEYDVDVVVNSDGGGTRTTRLSMTSIGEQRSEPTIDDLRQLFWVIEETGWDMEWQEDEEGEKTPVFTKTTTTSSVSGWEEMGEDIRISGTLDPRSQYHTELRNSIKVERETTESGTTLTYRETLAWDGLHDIAVGFLVDRFCYELQPAFPDLDETEIAELRGLLAGHLSVNLPDFLEDGADDENARPEVVALARQVKRVIEKEYQDVQLSTIYEILEWVLKDPGDATTRFLEKELPGVHLAGFTDLVLEVTMPGGIIDTNADEVEKHRVRWECGMLEAFSQPVEFYVRSSLSR